MKKMIITLPSFSQSYININEIPYYHFKKIYTYKDYEVLYSSFLKAFLIKKKNEKLLLETKNKQKIYKLKLQRDFFSHLFINITEKCNLKCRYCYAQVQTSKKPKSININFVKKVLNLTKLNVKKSSFVPIVFTGGEPTLEFSKLKFIKELILEEFNNYYKTNFTLWTNGVFSEKIAEWIVENIDFVQLSIDGPPKIQNFHRPLKNNKPSSQIVEKTLNFFSENYDKNWCVRSTITRYSLSKLLEIVEYFHEKGVKLLFLEPFHETYDKKLSSFSVNFIEFAKMFVKAIEFSLDHEITVSSTFAPFKRFDNFCGICLENICLNTDNSISACVEVMKKNIAPDFIYGEFSENQIKLDLKKIEILIERRPEKMNKCKNCIIKWNCAGDCALQNYYFTGSMFKPFKERCKAKKLILKGCAEIALKRVFLKEKS